MKNYSDDPNVKVCILDHLFFHQNLVFSSPRVSARQFLWNFVVQSFCSLHPEKTETDDSSSDQIDFDFFSGADDEDGGLCGWDVDELSILVVDEKNLWCMGCLHLLCSS